MLTKADCRLAAQLLNHTSLCDVEEGKNPSQHDILVLAAKNMFHGTAGGSWEDDVSQEPLFLACLGLLTEAMEKGWLIAEEKEGRWTFRAA